MSFLHVCHCRGGGVGTFLEVDDMLCHVVKSYEVMGTIVAFGRRRKREIKSSLDMRVMSIVSLDRLRSSTYALHLTELLPNNLDDALSLQPEFVHADHEEAERIHQDFR